MSEVDLEACPGVPDQHPTFDHSDVLTYYTNSSRSMSYSISVIGGVEFPMTATAMSPSIWRMAM